MTFKLQLTGQGFYVKRSEKYLLLNKISSGIAARGVENRACRYVVLKISSNFFCR